MHELYFTLLIRVTKLISLLTNSVPFHSDEEHDGQLVKNWLYLSQNEPGGKSFICKFLPGHIV